MNKLRNVSVKGKLFLPVAVIILSIVAFQTMYFPETQREAAEEALEAKGLSICRIVAFGVGAALEYQDGAVAADRIEGASQDPDLVYIALFTEKGEVLAEHELSEAPDLEKGLTDEPVVEIVGSVMHFRFPVAKNEVRGTLVAGLSLSTIANQHSEAQRVGFIIGAFILCIGFAIAYWLGASVANRLRVLSLLAEEVARGNLNVSGAHDDRTDEIGSMAASFNRMLENQKELVSQIAETALRINSSAGEILASSQHQVAGATEQSSAVEETRRTMDTLVMSSREIADTAGGVLNNAEMTYRNNQQIAKSISQLSVHTQRISEILEVIKDIANKTDLLALNAALEGTKAGEAGRGFSLVANQMQRLADTVMRSAVDIKNLTSDIRTSTSASVLATEEATKLASDTTQSARRINLIVQQQQSGTEQVSTALDDIHTVAQQTVAGSQQTVDATREMVTLSENLKALVGRFQVRSSSQNG
ncbi:MAG: hypothetical protein AUK47_10885 [Deltaproteobacteria bacterium CG2_30_63_29]|nr:MAG: hypothetical protein AUK47_10885 [Deltaproteobacteria bacterium CG2_30_63_29]